MASYPGRRGEIVRPPRFVTLHWSTEPRVLSFNDWLLANAPAGYRLASVVEHKAWSGHPEMGDTRECVFELSGGGS